MKDIKIERLKEEIEHSGVHVLPFEMTESQKRYVKLFEHDQNCKVLNPDIQLLFVMITGLSDGEISSVMIDNAEKLFISNNQLTMVSIVANLYREAKETLLLGLTKEQITGYCMKLSDILWRVVENNTHFREFDNSVKNTDEIVDRSLDVKEFTQVFGNVLSKTNVQSVYIAAKLSAQTLKEGMIFHIIVPYGCEEVTRRELNYLLEGTKNRCEYHAVVDRNLDMDFYCVWKNLTGWIHSNITYNEN